MLPGPKFTSQGLGSGGQPGEERAPWAGGTSGLDEETLAQRRDARRDRRRLAQASPGEGRNARNTPPQSPGPGPGPGAAGLDSQVETPTASAAPSPGPNMDAEMARWVAWADRYIRLLRLCCHGCFTPSEHVQRTVTAP